MYSTILLSVYNVASEGSGLNFVLMKLSPPIFRHTCSSGSKVSRPLLAPTIHLVMKPLHVKVMSGKRRCWLSLLVTLLILTFSAPCFRSERLRKLPVHGESAYD